MPEPFLSTGLIAVGYSAAVALSRPSSAVSHEAESVRHNASMLADQAHRSIALYGSKSKLISTLSALGDECREPDWDGYGSEPVNPVALERAGDLIESLPDDVSLPECSIDPDGSVSLDWLPSCHRSLTLSIGANERLPYAWVDGTDRGHAVAKLIDSHFPPRILDEIRRFSSHETSLGIT